MERSIDDAPIILNFDGLCEPRNPGGIATYGVIIRKGGKKLFEGAGLAYAEPWTPEASNNVAEYSAIIKGLEWLKQNGCLDSKILVRGDSRLIVSQLNGTFKVKAIRLVELFRRAAEILSEFKDIKIEWVDRSLNSEADLLSRIAYARESKRHPPK